MDPKQILAAVKRSKSPAAPKFKSSPTVRVCGTPKILVNNSFIYLKNIPDHAMAALAERLTYENKEAESQKISVLKTLKGAYYAYRSGRISSWLQKQLDKLDLDLPEFIKHMKGELARLENEKYVCMIKPGDKVPTGLAQMVLETLDLALGEGTYEVEDVRVVPEPVVRYKWKKEPFEPWPHQADMIKISDSEERGVFEASVASGKTLIEMNVVYEKRQITLVILPSSPLLEQTKNEFEDHFGKTFVQHVETSDVKEKGKLKPIRLVTIQTLASMQEQGLLSRFLKDVGMVLVDEAHHAGSKSYTDLLEEMDHIYYRYSFTGTYTRNDSKKLDLYGFSGVRLYYYPPKQAIEDGHVAKPIFHLRTLNGTSSKKYQDEYEANFCGGKPLMSEIVRIMKEIPQDKQVLILVDRKDASGKLIHKMLNLLNIENSYISGDDKKGVIADTIKKFNAHKVRVLIGSTVIGEGIDVHSTEYLILATGGKSEIKIPQACGRAVRGQGGKKKICHIYDFRFTDTNFMEKHFEDRMQIYQEQFGGEYIFE